MPLTKNVHKPTNCSSYPQKKNRDLRAQRAETLSHIQNVMAENYGKFEVRIAFMQDNSRLLACYIAELLLLRRFGEKVGINNPAIQCSKTEVPNLEQTTTQ